MQRLIYCGIVCLGTALTIVSALAVPAARGDFTFSPEPGVTVKVKRSDDSHLTVRFLPDGATQQIPEPAADPSNGESFDGKDYSFDGYKDLAIVNAVGMVNEAYSIWLYHKDKKRFEKLSISGQQLSTCGSLMGVELRSKEHVLLSTCRSGPTWYTDAYRYADGHRLYLYGTTSGLVDTLASKLCPGNASDDSLTMFGVRFDANGRPVAQACEPYQNWRDIDADSRVRFKVPIARLALYDSRDGKPAQRYLVRGDTVDVLGVSSDGGSWIQIRFQNPHRGTIIGWIRLEDFERPDEAPAGSQR
ncbi:XAC2610-related protein [Paraburkholderia bannensis]|uniref:XAC2610-related protein n=1 Tax=Paraburkholderia bannensis TaxID=765414 RepID=UPI002AB687D7|nr:hypothetical protein [Paraburkholderia bannensis]